MRLNGGPGLFASARLLIALGLIGASAPGWTQQRPPEQPRPQAQPQQAGVDPLVSLKLIWSALAALDHANQTGNYSVLRDLGAPSFQTNNSAATLAGLFQALRAQRVDVGNALIVMPTFEIAPTILPNGLLRARGSFPLRPTGIGFDLLFQNVGGQWRLFGMAVVPVGAQPAQQPSTRR